jgi:hypothetical protein
VITRNATFKIRLSDQELELYKLTAGSEGMTTSDWIRSKCAPEQRHHSDSSQHTSLPNGQASLARVPRTGLCVHRIHPRDYCPRCD